MRGRLHRAVIIACTAAKLGRPASAARIYTGVTWSTWRRHAPDDGALPGGWSLWALSARHGLLRSWKMIAPYNERLTAARVSLLAPLVRRQWDEHLEWLAEHRLAEAAECAVVGGELYQELARAAGLPVALRIDGRARSGRGGIGLLRQRLARWADFVRSERNAYPGDAARAWDSRAMGLEGGAA